MVEEGGGKEEVTDESGGVLNGAWVGAGEVQLQNVVEVGILRTVYNRLAAPSCKREMALTSFVDPLPTLDRSKQLQHVHLAQRLKTLDITLGITKAATHTGRPR